MALPEALRGARWTQKTARRMMPLLVWCAERGEKVEYGQMDVELQRRGGHHVFLPQYGHPAGAIGDALMESSKKLDERIPPLNALLVNKSGYPGSGCDWYLTGYVEKKRRTNLNDEQHKSMAEETMNGVWTFGRWAEILHEYGLRPETRGIPALMRDGAAMMPRKGGWSTGPESRAHCELKIWVAENPQILGSTIPFRAGETEWLFASADRADVMFEHSEGCVAVEVKASTANEDELERGIYQCVKYQALLRAELKATRRIPNGKAILITERQLTPRPRELAKLLGVQVILVSR